MSASDLEQNCPQLVTGGDQIRRAVADARRTGKRVGLVPTMGWLHEGHLSLVQTSRAECDVTVVTIFVNPTQFGPNEDFARYPRDLDRDRKLLAEHGADLVFAPDVGAMYPAGFSTYVDPPAVARVLEGECRPGHFRGVTTIVLKLFQLVPADAAYFGEKDFQQLLVIRHMVEDLNVPIDIRPCPIVREEDGLALSSRNAYLNADERLQALSLSRSLQVAAELVDQGQLDSAVVQERMKQVFSEAGVTAIDYIALVDPQTLEPVERLDSPTRALVAARVGQTRLIDNRQIG